MGKQSDIAQRLKEFGQAKFGTEHGWKKQFADALGVTTQHLDRYLSGASEPGNKMYLRLVQLDCDIRWLLTGQRSSPQRQLRDLEKEILRELQRAGIDSVEKMRYLLSPENLAADIAAAVKEIQAKYQKKKKGGRKRK